MSGPARAKRLARELQECKKDSVVQIEQVGGDSIDHFIGSFPGPTGTPYEGGWFKVDVVAPERYPFEPLKMKFITKVYHPNVSSQSGYICLDILKTSWSPVFTLRTCLVSLQSLLSTPEPTDPQDAIVAKHYLTDKRGFEETAKYWTEVYAAPPTPTPTPTPTTSTSISTGGGGGGKPNSRIHSPSPQTASEEATNKRPRIQESSSFSDDDSVQIVSPPPPPPPLLDPMEIYKKQTRLAGLDWEDVQSFLEMGFEPERVLEVLVRLNWRKGNRDRCSQEEVVEQEQLAESKESSLLLSNTPLQTLVKAGLALTNLSPTTSSNGGVSIGLGGKTMVELSRNSATGGGLGSHDFKNGDLVKVGNGTSSTSASNGKKGKGVGNKKGKEKDSQQQGQEIETVVFKVSNDKITLVLNDRKHKNRGDVVVEEEEDDGNSFEWTDKITLFKVSNPSTFKRQIHFLRQAIRSFEVVEPSPLPPSTAAGEEETPVKTEEEDDDDDSSSSDSDRDDEPKEEDNTKASSSSSSNGVSPLLSVLLGLSPPTLSPPPPPTSSLNYFDPKLNSSQREAVEFCLRCREVGMIWGPPGTGKTQTLIEIIKQLILNQDQRVLVCGASNLSVDNILSRLSHQGEEKEKKIELSRLGHPARVLGELTNHTLDSQSTLNDQTFLVKDIQTELLQLTRELGNRDKKTRLRGSDRKKKWELVRELRKDMRKRLNRVEKEVLRDKMLVFSTTHGAGSKVLDRLDQFDVVIIDEAAQATEPACWIPIMRGKKLILAGDHLQLPPTLKSISSSSPSSTTLPTPGPSRLKLSKTLETTLFSRLLSLHGNEIRKMLKIQYRFNEKINEFPSKMLYDDELKPSREGGISTRKLGDLLKKQGDEGEGVSVGEGDLEDLNEPIVFFDTAGLGMYERGGGGGEDGEPGQTFRSESKSNENEAEIVLHYVKFLLESKIPPSSISIISPYSSQVSLLSSLLHQTSLPPPPSNSTNSSNSNSNSIEIGSIDSNQGRENDVVIISLVRSNEEGEIGFLKELRRLNVAMTRARRQLVVVGDSETLKKQGSSSSSSSITNKVGRGGEDKKKKQKQRHKVGEVENKDVVELEMEKGENDRSTVSSGESEGEEEDTQDEGTEEERGQDTKTSPVPENEPNSSRTRKQQQHKQKKVTGARYLKEWIEWLEENAYVRVP
ncbi:hypothetical protein JCM5350_005702 [Sporobolomyces pararoseus]